MKNQSKLLYICITLVFFYQSGAQPFNLPWQQVTQVPTTDLFSINNIANQLYVSEGNRVHYSTDNGNTWNMSSALTPSPVGGNDIIAFNGKLYLASFGKGVFVSSDNGHNWSQLNSGLGSSIPIKFIVRNGSLYAATDDNGIYKLNATGTQWTDFSNGLASGGWPTSFNCLESYSDGLIGGVSANGFVVYREDTATVWKGAALTGSITAGLFVYDLVYTGNYIWAITNSKVYASSNKGITWTHVDAGMRNGYFNKAVNVSGTLYVGVNYMGTCFLYKRNILDPLANAWTPVDTLNGLDCYGMSQINSRFYMATSKGLYYLDLNVATGLPETTANRETFNIVPNPAAYKFELIAGAGQAFKNLSVYDMQGKKIFSMRVGVKETIDVSALEEGFYYAEVTLANNSIQRKKIIIKR